MGCSNRWRRHILDCVSKDDIKTSTLSYPRLTMLLSLIYTAQDILALNVAKKKTMCVYYYDHNVVLCMHGLFKITFGIFADFMCTSTCSLKPLDINKNCLCGVLLTVKCLHTYFYWSVVLTWNWKLQRSYVRLEWFRFVAHSFRRRWTKKDMQYKCTYNDAMGLL